MKTAGVAELEWELAPARSGEATLRIGRCFVHSRYAPRREAARLADDLAREAEERGASFLLLLGAGLGYLPEALLGRLRIPIVVWDPFPGIRAEAGVDVAGVRSRARLLYQPSELDEALALHARPGARPQFFVHPGYQEITHFECRYALRALRRSFAAESTLRLEDAIVSSRSIDFFQRFSALRSVEQLAGCLEGQTVVLAAAGPSLAGLRELLAERRGGVVMAVVQALRPLAQAGAHADFAVISDPRDYSGYVEGFAPRFDALLADTAVAPDFLDRWREKTFLFHLRTPHAQQLVWDACGLESIDEPVVTVSETALRVAHALGARRFLLAGLDLSTQSEDPRFPGVGLRASSSEGKVVWSNPAYFQAARYLSWLCPKLLAEGCEIWRAGSGLPIAGTTPIDGDGVTELLGDAARFELPALPPVEGGARKEKLISVLHALEARSGDPGEEDRELASNRVGEACFHPLVAAARREACARARRRLEEPHWKSAGAP